MSTWFNGERVPDSIKRNNSTRGTGPATLGSSMERSFFMFIKTVPNANGLEFKLSKYVCVI